MSAWWIGPLALGAGGAASLAIVARALLIERHATEQATEALRSLRPALASSRRHTQQAVGSPRPHPGAAGRGEKQAAPK